MLKAAPGTRFLDADLSNIEGRVNAWNAGEQWKLDAFRLADWGLSYGLYEITAAGIIGCGLDQVSKAQRQAQGKIPELACGYMGSVGAFVSMAANYQTKPEDVADIAAQTVPPDVWAKTLARWRPNTSAGLEPHVWTGIKCVVDGWRAKHPAIVKSWYDLQDAAIMAVSQPGTVLPCCKVRYLCSKGFLWCQLPSGRVMAYPQPRIIRQKTERLTPRPDYTMTDLTVTWWPTGNGDSVMVKIGDHWYEQRADWSNVVEVWGLEKGQWRPYTLYGGLQCANVCQGIARDVLASAMLRIEAAGYPIVLHAHDNVLCECRVGFGSRQELKDLLSQGEPWTAGLPLDAKTSEDARYK